TIKGIGREQAEIVFNLTGAGLTATDKNITISDLTLKVIGDQATAFEFTNLTKDKVFTMKDCEFRDCLNGFEVIGFELVDLLNNLFIGWRGGSTIGNIGCWFSDVSKLQITSCEFVKWVETLPSTNPFAGEMILVGGTAVGAVNITSCIIHPRVAQDGIKIGTATTFLEFVVSSNTFIDVGLTTGLLINQNTNPNYPIVAIEEANSGRANLKATSGWSYLDLVAPATTTLTAINTPVNIVFNTGAPPFSIYGDFGVSLDTTTNIGRITYNRKRPVNFQITAVAEVLFTGGNPATQEVGITIAKNGASLFGAGVVSYQQLTAAGTQPRQYTFGVIGSAAQNDYFEFQLVSASTIVANSDFEVRTFQVAGIEI
ncbi:MAG: hypothetical protein ACYS8I_15105, partial [Planctomycetota bacterium]